jgi:membrane protein implicated in regulation of membrane protease activity
MNTLFELTQSTAFMLVFGIGFVYIIVSNFLSSIFDFGDSDGGDAGDLDPSHEGTVSIFSPQVLSIFFMGFGLAGLFATNYGFSPVVSTGFGFGGGVALGALGLLGLRLLAKQQASSEVLTANAVGRSGVVSVAIPHNGTGEIDVTVSGQLMTYAARAERAIGRNATVKVKAVQGSILLVE